MTRDLGLGPVAGGGVLASGGIGAFAGATRAGGAACRLAIGPAIVWSQVVCATGAAVPLAVFVPSLAVPLLTLAEAVQYGALAIDNVAQISLRQALAPEAAPGTGHRHAALPRHRQRTGRRAARRLARRDDRARPDAGRGHRGHRGVRAGGRLGQPVAGPSPASHSRQPRRRTNLGDGRPTRRAEAVVRRAPGDVGWPAC